MLAGAEPEESATVITASGRGVDGVAFRDVIGANAAITTVALGVGATVTVMPFGPRIRRYETGGLAAAGVAGRATAPALGETAELDEERDHVGPIGRELVLVLIGLCMLTAGSIALVEGVRRISGGRRDPDQARTCRCGIRHGIRVGRAGLVGEP